MQNEETKNSQRDLKFYIPPVYQGCRLSSVIWLRRTLRASALFRPVINLQHIGHFFLLRRDGPVQRCFAFHVPGIHLRAGFKQKFHDIGPAFCGGDV